MFSDTPQSAKFVSQCQSPNCSEREPGSWSPCRLALDAASMEAPAVKATSKAARFSRSSVQSWKNVTISHPTKKIPRCGVGLSIAHSEAEDVWRGGSRDAHSAPKHSSAKFLRLSRLRLGLDPLHSTLCCWRKQTGAALSDPDLRPEGRIERQASSGIRG